MVDVRMRHHNLLQLEFVLLQQRQNPGNIVARIHNHCLARVRIPENAAIALQHTHRKRLAQQRHERGELLMNSTADFLTSSSGPALDGTPATPTGGIALGFGLKGTLTHYNRVNQFDSYVQDDIKVNSRLTVNLGVRWEFAGFPDDKSGQFSKKLKC